MTIFLNSWHIYTETQDNSNTHWYLHPGKIN